MLHEKGQHMFLKGFVYQDQMSYLLSNYQAASNQSMVFTQGFRVEAYS